DEGEGEGRVELLLPFVAPSMRGKASSGPGSRGEEAAHFIGRQVQSVGSANQVVQIDAVPVAPGGIAQPGDIEAGDLSGNPLLEGLDFAGRHRAGAAQEGLGVLTQGRAEARMVGGQVAADAYRA